MAIIQVEELSKQFKRTVRKEGFWGAVGSLFHPQYEVKTAVDRISFEIQEGEVVGYLGPNGAGKSTTIKMMSGILVPTSGQVKVNGVTPYRNRTENAKQIGVVFGQRTQLWWDIPVSESLNLMRYMYNISNEQYRRNLDMFADILDIHEFIHVPVRQLSLGQRMRADLCAALLHNPKILFLDEPTIGLDVVVKEKIRTFIKEINQLYHTTVILTTHDMSDIEKLCSRVIVIDRGKAMYDGSLADLKTTYGSQERMLVETDFAAEDLEGLYQLGVTGIEQELKKLTITYDRRRLNSTTVIGWLLAKYKVTDFVVEETNVEEIIRTMYGTAPQRTKAGANT